MTGKIVVDVVIESEVDSGWIEFITGGDEGFVDVFLGGHCGYWLEGIKHSPSRGWLAYEFSAEDRHATDDEKREAILAFIAGGKPAGGCQALRVRMVRKQ